jgi:hypothetical protein
MLIPFIPPIEPMPIVALLFSAVFQRLLRLLLVPGKEEGPPGIVLCGKGGAIEGKAEPPMGPAIGRGGVGLPGVCCCIECSACDTALRAAALLLLFAAAAADDDADEADEPRELREAEETEEEALVGRLGDAGGAGPVVPIVATGTGEPAREEEEAAPAAGAGEGPLEGVFCRSSVASLATAGKGEELVGCLDVVAD